MKPRVVDYLSVIEEEKEIAEQLVPFDEIVAEESGTAPKGFVMIKGRSIGEIYDIIKNQPHTHYKFCGHDFIINSTKKEFEKTMFSAVIRKSRKGTDFSSSELIGSRIAELFGVDCPYVASLGKSKRIVASLDFLKYSQEMETFSEFTGAMFNRQASVGAWARRLDKKISTDEKFSFITNEQKSKLIKEVIRHYIVRKFLLKDNDFNCSNLAIVQGADSCPSLVSFDFEFCLNNSMLFDHSSSLPENFMQSNIEELYYIYPNELMFVINELHMTTEKSLKIKAILEKYLDEISLAELWFRSIDWTINELEYITTDLIKKEQNEDLYERK